MAKASKSPKGKALTKSAKPDRKPTVAKAVKAKVVSSAKPAKVAGPKAGAKTKSARDATVREKVAAARDAEVSLIAVQSGRKALAKANKKKAEQDSAQKIASIEVTRSVTARLTVETKESSTKKTRSKSSDVDLSELEKPGQLAQKWSSLFKKSQDLVAKPYNMKQSYEAKTPIMHKVLGWGYILTNKNDRLEVLFKDGIRFLISNYRS